MLADRKNLRPMQADALHDAAKGLQITAGYKSQGSANSELV